MTNKWHPRTHLAVRALPPRGTGTIVLVDVIITGRSVLTRVTGTLIRVCKKQLGRIRFENLFYIKGLTTLASKAHSIGAFIKDLVNIYNI